MSPRHSQALERFGFFVSPLTLAQSPDVLICSVDTQSPLVNLAAALNYEVTPVSTRNLSRWLYLLARDLSGARPVRFPVVYRPISVVGADIFIRCLDTIGPEIFPFDSPDQLPPGCYALFDSDGNPYAHPVGRTIPRRTFVDTERAWDVPDHDPRAADRMTRPVPEFLATQARKRDGGLCCFTGNPSNCVTWIIPPLLSQAVAIPGFSREQCHSLENVFTISPSIVKAYHQNLITVDPQDAHRVVVFKHLPDVKVLERLASPPSSGRFWHASLCWTLAVRLAGCDARFDGRTATEAEELYDELTFEHGDGIPLGPRWSTAAGQEAIRAFFWGRSEGPSAPWQWEEWDVSSSSDGEQHSWARTSTTLQLLFSGWWSVAHYMFALIFRSRRRL
ncbi:hypothetical protein C8R47DRAFT_1210494 [Mycena vitilis]|nr:hypothetical protein C8R47DRAFT_1210494 [Mycena vitilis]